MRTSIMAMVIIPLLGVTLVTGAFADAPRALRPTQLDKMKPVQSQPPAAETSSGKAELIPGPVVLEPHRPELRCSSTDTTCGDRPAWPLEISMQVTNRGTAPSPQVKAQVRVTPGRDYQVNIPPLYPGSSYDLLVTHNFNTLGHTEVRVEIDPDHRVFSYTNLSNILQMEIRPAKAELVISSFRADNRYVLQTAQFSVVVTNTGAVRSERTTTLKAVFVNSRAGTKTLEVPMLRPGESHTLTMSHKYRSKGGKQINLILDPENKIDEIDEGNNTSIQTFNIIYP